MILCWSQAFYLIVADTIPASALIRQSLQVLDPKLRMWSRRIRRQQPTQSVNNRRQRWGQHCSVPSHPPRSQSGSPAQTSSASDCNGRECLILRPADFFQTLFSCQQQPLGQRRQFYPQQLCLKRWRNKDPSLYCVLLFLRDDMYIPAFVAFWLTLALFFGGISLTRNNNNNKTLQVIWDGSKRANIYLQGIWTILDHCKER